MKCPKCESMYDRTAHEKCPTCGRITNDLSDLIELEKVKEEVPIESQGEIKEKKKKKSLGFYLIIAFLSFILLTVSVITYSIVSFTKKIEQTSIISKEITDTNINDEDSIQLGEENFDIFGDRKELYTLSVKDIYKSDEDFYKDIELLKNTISPEFEKFENNLDSKENLKAAFELYDKGYFITEKIYWYAQYQVSLDASDDDVQNLADEADSVIQAFTESSSYMWPELSMKDENTLRDILNYEGISKLDYKRTLEQLIDMKAHILSPETEDALAMLTTFNSAPKNIWDKLKVLDTTFYVYRMDDGTILDLGSDENIASYQSNPDIAPKLFEYYTAMDRQNENALAEILMSEVQKNLAYSKIKKYDNFLDYELSYDEVPSELYLNLLKKIDENISTLHKYQELENKMYDNNLFPIISNEFSMDRSRKILSESYKVYGKDYIDRFNFALDNNWFDLIPREFKEEGAYTSGMKLVHPYIVMTYNGTLADLSTLTHEYGHMANYKYSQDAVNGSSWTPNAFTAEVPSTFNEAILSDYLRSSADTNDEKLAYLNNELNLINNTFFYQAMLAEFQHKIYVEVNNGNVLSADELNKLFGKLYIKYYGPTVEDFMFEGTNNYWSQISHFYSGFYVYKYSTSVAIAYSVKEKISSGEITMDDYLKFLEHGAIVSPSDSLNTLNIDLKSDKWMDDFFKYYETLVNEYDELLKLKESK